MNPALCIPILSVVLCCSCAARKAAVQSRRADSVRIVRQVEVIERVRDTTVYVPVPAESRETVRQDSSHLETAVALSDAVIRADGSLFHTLANKPAVLRAEVPLREKERRVQAESAAVQSERVEVPVRMPLSWRERFWGTSGRIAWGVLAGAVLIGIVKKRRR